VAKPLFKDLALKILNERREEMTDNDNHIPKKTVHDPPGARMIITAASASFGPSLLALLGSLNLNWPNHPPVRVYDIGLDEATLKVLQKNNVNVVKVRSFCDHWRKHFTWKIWCWNDAPARKVLWIDSGVVILQPVNEVFDALDALGYFAVPTYHLLTENASENACDGCGVSPGFREGKMTLAGTFIGFRKEGIVGDIIKEALKLALIEKNIASTEKMHRHDQALISILLYKNFQQVVMADGTVYCGWLSPQQVPGQKVWVHRREINAKDFAHFASHITSAGPPYLPNPPVKSGRFRTQWQKIFGTPERFIRRMLRGQINASEKPYDGIRNR